MFRIRLQLKRFASPNRLPPAHFNTFSGTIIISLSIQTPKTSISFVYLSEDYDLLTKVFLIAVDSCWQTGLERSQNFEGFNRNEKRIGQ